MKCLGIAVVLFTTVALGCEWLVKLDYTPHPDPAQEPGKYKPGEIVVIKEDGKPWGRLETLPLFLRIQVPGIEAAVFREYLMPIYDEQTNLVRRRTWQITTNTMPDMLHNKLMTTGTLIVRASPVLELPEFDVEWTDFSTNILNHVTGQVETRRIVGLIREARLR